jgi:uncharacterized membrane protein HdeD (DUF308 family)
METKATNEARQNLLWFALPGILMIILGIAAIAEPFMATITVGRLLNWIFLFAGIVRIVYTLRSPRQPNFWLNLLIGVLYIAAALLLFSKFFGAVLTLTLAFGWVIIAQGILEMVMAFKLRPEPNWVWMLFSGIMAIVLGILILSQWLFVGAAWLIGLFLGIDLLLTGIWMILLPWVATPTEQVSA